MLESFCYKWHSAEPLLHDDCPVATIDAVEVGERLEADSLFKALGLLRKMLWVGFRRQRVLLAPESTFCCTVITLYLVASMGHTVPFNVRRLLSKSKKRRLHGVSGAICTAFAALDIDPGAAVGRRRNVRGRAKCGRGLRVCVRAAVHHDWCISCIRCYIIVCANCRVREH